MNEKAKKLVSIDMLRYFEILFKIPKSPVFDNEVYYDIYNKKKRYIHVYGGRGSGKSHEVVGKLPVVLLTCLPFARLLCLRTVNATHRTSTFQEVRDYIDKWQLGKYFKITIAPLQVTCLLNGNYMVWRGLDKPESIKSIKDITHVFWEEMLENDDEESFATIDKSVRTPRLELDIHRHFILYNPTDKTHWIYKQFHDDDEQSLTKYEYYRRNSYFLNTTYRDNKFVSQIFIDILEAERVSNPDRYQVDGLGNWGVLPKLGLFYHQFKYEKQVFDGLLEKHYDLTKPLYLTFDFNVFPYITLEIAQMKYNPATNELQMIHIDEICLQDAARMGKVQETCKEFLKRFARQKGDVFVCGDRSGNSRKTTSASDFSTIFAMLRKTNPQEFIEEQQGTVRVRINPYPDYEKLECTFKVVDITIKSQNPPLAVRKIFFERLHSGQIKVLPLGREYGTITMNGERRDISAFYANCRIIQLIDARCIKLVKDYQEVKEIDGGGGKDSRKPELTHTSDAADYLYTQIFECEFKQILAQLKR